MNPTDHAAKRAKLVQERDAAKANADKLALVYRAEVEKLDAELAAFDATPAYPSVTFTAEERGFATDVTVSWDSKAFRWNVDFRCASAAQVACEIACDEKIDAIVTRLLALKGAAASGEPWGWVNAYDADPCIIRWNSEAEAKEAAIRGAKYVTLPLYRHPPTPVAYQKVGACVMKDGARTDTYGASGYPPQDMCEANAVAYAGKIGGTAHVLYAGEALTP